ncbi:peroxiredoxin-like family protein [Colwellia sp. RSH04]|uniref:peroxiredoxin-like family protein n=1 Tax=Colwellia sp. RSH04 TaxID=2305464 RepID=UPI000E58F625|nr:peroxiredoxin-like family protein [Colwellia sp. RSH04]RHW77487.1 AhpC/TSA family protein [Colwellia sp. RSH04]
MSVEYTTKLHAGADFPAIEVKLLNGDVKKLSTPENGLDWNMVVVYRGQHCPLCTRYLNQLENAKDLLAQTGVDLIAVSGDSKEQLESHMERLDVTFPIAYGLTVEQMVELGLYISDPRSPEETDHSFPEPGLFVVNNQGKVHVVDISNNPFVRPELQSLINGLAWIRNPDNNYPIRGMYT